MKSIYLVLIFMLCHAVSAQESIGDADLSKYVNKQIQYCDQVSGTFVSKGENQVILLNLGADYPDQKMVVAIFGKSLKDFDYKPDEFLNGKMICVKGKLVLYKGKPEIVVKSQKQIEVR